MLNDEEILELCLSVISNNPDKKLEYPGKYVANYILEDKGGSFLTDEELNNKINDLVAAYELKVLTDLGLLNATFEDDGTTSYSPSDCCDINLYLDLYYEGLEISQDMEKVWGRLSEEDKQQIKLQLLKE